MSYNESLRNFGESLQVLRVCSTNRFDYAQCRAKETLGALNQSQSALLKALWDKYGGDVAAGVFRLLEADLS